MAMATLFAEEDYIDMDISSTTSFLCYDTSSSPPHAMEFEFQMSLNTPQREALTSPADELFYKGKLLPLHLPPRLQMVQKLLHNSDKDFDPFFEDNAVATSAQTAASTPFESCNISPATSCYVSGELNPEDYFQECSYSGFVEPQQKKSWAKKLKFVSKLKAIKSLFTKSKGAEESCIGFPPKESSNNKAGRRNPFGLIHTEQYPVDGSLEKDVRDKLRQEEQVPRRSFSFGAKRTSMKTKSCSTSSSSCSSSSSSSSSISLSSKESCMLRRSSSVHSELEGSIQGAIAHCKMSQQLACGRKRFE